MVFLFIAQPAWSTLGFSRRGPRSPRGRRGTEGRRDRQRGGRCIGSRGGVSAETISVIQPSMLTRRREEREGDPWFAFAPFAVSRESGLVTACDQSKLEGRRRFHTPYDHFNDASACAIGTLCRLRSRKKLTSRKPSASSC